MKKHIRTILIITFGLFIGLNYSCKEDQSEIDREIIEQYINDNNLSAIELDNTGLFYVIEKAGGNLHPTTSSTVTAKYRGKLVDGTMFDANDGVAFLLSNTIYGWQLGIPLIGESGQIKLLIPSELGYGTRGNDNIPADAVLIFDVELLLFN